MIGTAIGTPQYMSPEQADGRLDELGSATDVYSLGATLYCLLTAQAPFPNADVAETLAKVRRGACAPPRQVKPGVPAALDAVCRKAMALGPADRYATPLQLAADVEHWLADEPVRAYREPASARLARWARRLRPHVAAAAGLLVTAVVALAIGIVAVNSERRQTVAAYVALAQEQGKSEAARALAEEHFALAKDAVQKYLTTVAQSPELKQTPKMHELRKKLLEAAVPFYEKLAAQRAEDCQQEAERGRANSTISVRRLTFISWAPFCIAC